MIYNDFQDLKLSALGMGCMRFPMSGDNIDIEKTREMVDYAIKNGINYFDTAWGYHEGKSEMVIGEILSAYPRDSFYLADKFPGYDRANFLKKEQIFEKQLRKCKTQYFDFYLLHTIAENNIDDYLDDELGLFCFLLEQREKGRIKHLGFSAHAELDTIKRLLDKYGDELEFCQLQINWFDWDFQNAKEKVELVASYNIPVWVMEPVRGGNLARLSDTHTKKLQDLRPNATPAEWAFRFVQSIPEVTVTLSGMSDFSQVKENINTFNERKPLTDSEAKALFEIYEDISQNNTLQCTSCRYCTSYCPNKLDIPELINIYNQNIVFVNSIDKSKLTGTKDPNLCVACGACERVCPQGIKISEMMRKLNI